MNLLNYYKLNYVFKKVDWKPSQRMWGAYRYKTPVSCTSTATSALNNLRFQSNNSFHGNTRDISTGLISLKYLFSEGSSRRYYLASRLKFWYIYLTNRFRVAVRLFQLQDMQLPTKERMSARRNLSATISNLPSHRHTQRQQHDRNVHRTHRERLQNKIQKPHRIIPPR